MMGHTKLGRHQKVLTLYNEALESSAKVSASVCVSYTVFVFVMMWSVVECSGV